MVSAIQSIIERINGQRSPVNRLSQSTAVNESDQQVVHLFIDASSSGKHVYPGICRYVSIWPVLVVDQLLCRTIQFLRLGVIFRPGRTNIHDRCYFLSPS